MNLAIVTLSRNGRSVAAARVLGLACMLTWISGVVGCERGSSTQETPRHVAEAVTGGDGGSDAAAPLTPTACVVSLGALQLGDNDTIQSSVAGAGLQLGSGVKVTGNAFSSANATLGNQSAISGTLAYTGTLSEGSGDTVGVLQHAAVSAPTIATETVTVGTTDVTVAGGATQTIAPGAYRNVNIGSGAHVTFNPGVYAVASLTVQGGATVTFNTMSAIALRVQGAVNWGSSTVSASDPTKVGLYTGGTSVQFGAGLVFLGSITAPAAAIAFGSGDTIKGCVAAKSLVLPASTTVTGSTNACAAAADGAPCNDGNACTQNDSCHAGVCTGGAAVTCTASDTCHSAGTCNPSTGACSNPVAANGVACNDGNACTQNDSCQAGVCTGGAAVTCTASDTCHSAGTCNPSTGACSNPVAANGVACNDGNACTQNDSCQAGVCTGGAAVTCTASDACHSAGTCNPSTGACSNPVAANGVACNDGNACTQNDSCQAGVCTGGAAVTCTASDACHSAGTCNPSTGACSNPVAANGVACNDGNACTQVDTCQSGVCSGSQPIVCTAMDACHLAGTCSPSTGACSTPAAPDGTACTGTNKCDQTYACAAGACTGSNPVVCAAAGTCHVAGTCDPTSGVCSSPVAANGSPCDDGNPCTQNDTCTNGTCAGTGQCAADAGASDGSAPGDGGADGGSGTGPVWPAGAIVAIAPTGPTSARIPWTAATDAVGVTAYEVFENGQPVATVGGAVLTDVVTGLDTGAQYVFTVQASDAAGFTTTNGPSATFVGQTPTPALVAPPLDLTVATSVAAATSFIYSGTDPIQVGLTANINPLQVALLQGRVLDVNDNPLLGVAITVAGHPEYGHTTTAADGTYHLVVNGGGSVTLTYDIAGLLHAERTQPVPWQDFLQLPDVVLVAHDPAVTTTDVSGAAAIQVVRGSPVTDSFGTRRPTLMLAAGTTAEMVLPSGQTQAMTSASIRATEYTVGPNGPNAMPAPLPATSGYTYAAALTVDEAEASGATEVHFSTPVAVYLENFLQVRVGVRIPSGYYDATSHLWIPSTDGRAIGVLSSTGTSATIDVDGAGQPATSAELAALGITADELGQVAALYAPGQTLWRVPVEHFTPWDFNMGTKPQDGATAPSAPDPTAGSGGDSDCDHSKPGCILDVEDQVLGEEVPVGGTPFALHYRSDRTPGYVDARTLTIPLTTAAPPTVLQGVQLEVDVAGQQILKSFGGGAGQSYTFVWNQQDGFGRPVQGRFPVTVRVGYVYNAVYLAPSDEPNFTQYDQEFGHYTYFGTPATTDGRTITLWRQWTGHIGQLDQTLMGLGDGRSMSRTCTIPTAGFFITATGIAARRTRFRTSSGRSMEARLRARSSRPPMAATICSKTRNSPRSRRTARPRASPASVSASASMGTRATGGPPIKQRSGRRAWPSVPTGRSTWPTWTTAGFVESTRPGPSRSSPAAETRRIRSTEYPP